MGAGWARLTGEKESTISVSRFYVSSNSDDNEINAKITIVDPTHYIFSGNGFELKGTVGELIDGNGVSIKIDSIDASVGTTFNISLVTRLKAITDLQKMFAVSDQGKDTGILTLTVTGENPVLIRKYLIALVKIILRRILLDRQLKIKKLRFS